MGTKQTKTPHLLHLQVLFFDLSDVRLAFVVLQRVKAGDELFSGDKNCRYVQLVRLFQLRKCKVFMKGRSDKFYKYRVCSPRSPLIYPTIFLKLKMCECVLTHFSKQDLQQFAAFSNVKSGVGSVCKVNVLT